jgi:GNAT superfamily N-acetyltransferase
MTSVLVREALESDLTAVLRTYANSGIDGNSSFDLEEAREHFARFRQYPSYRLFVALVDGEIVGAYSLLIMDNLAKRGAKSGIIEDVAVLPDQQRRGVGRAMMQHALEHCRIAGCYKVALSSNLNRKSGHRFYESLGFERHGFSFVIRP